MNKETKEHIQELIVQEGVSKVLVAYGIRVEELLTASMTLKPFTPLLPGSGVIFRHAYGVWGKVIQL